LALKQAALEEEMFDIVTQEKLKLKRNNINAPPDVPYMLQQEYD